MQRRDFLRHITAGAAASLLPTTSLDAQALGFRLVDATAYPLFGAAEEMHGVVNVFWQATTPDEPD